MINDDQNKIIIYFFLTLFLIHASACNSREPLGTERIITVVDSNSLPLDNVQIKISQKNYTTNKNGQVYVKINEIDEIIHLTFTKEGYENVNINVPGFFIGKNDRYTLNKKPVIESYTTIHEEKQVVEEVIVHVDNKVSKQKVVEEVAKVAEEPVTIDYRELYSKAEFNKETGNWEKAIDFYDQIGKDDLELYTKAKFNSGFIRQVKLNDFTSAIKDYNAALESHNPKNFAEIYFGRAVSYYHLGKWQESAADFKRSFRYANYFTGNPEQRKKKYHDLLYFWADALVRKANLEPDKTRQLKYYQDAVSKIEDYIDKFENYDSRKTKQMYNNLKIFNNKINNLIN